MSSDAAFQVVAENYEQVLFSCTQHLKRAAYALDRAILSTKLRPSIIVIFTIFATVSVIVLLSLIKRLARIRKFGFVKSQDRFVGFKRAFFSWIKSLPLTQRMIRNEKEKLIAHLTASKKKFLRDETPITALPEDGWSSHLILNHLKERKKRDVQIPQRESMVSGAIYVTGTDLEDLLCNVYRIHSMTSPLHPDVFPSVRQLEAEVISICGRLLDPQNNAKNICGAMTSGGSESILLAMKASISPRNVEIYFFLGMQRLYEGNKRDHRT